MISFESAAKKLCRLSFWANTLELLGEKPEERRCAGLCGSEAGDFRTLRGLGVAADNILLFDDSKAAADDSEECEPDLTVIRKRIERAIDAYPTVDAILLDFGAHIDKTTLGVTQRTATVSKMNEGGVFAMSFLAGRELHATWLKKAVEDFIAGQRGMPEDVWSLWSRSQPCMAWALYVTQQVFPIKQQGLRLHLNHLWMYEARDDYGKGSHVFTVQYQWRKGTPPHPLAQVCAAAQHPTARVPSGYYASRYVGKNAMWLLQEGANPELLLNISAGSARSYRGRNKAGAYA
jgi:hypothetical protein